MRLIIYQQHQELNNCFYCNRTPKQMDQQQDINTSSRRLHILSASEVEALYGRPQFTDEERAHFFALTAKELTELSALHTFGSCTLFILQLGYFKAVQQFFVLEPADVASDIEWIQRAYFANIKQPVTLAGRTTRLKQQKLILELAGYRPCGETAREQLRTRAAQAVHISSKPLFILRDLRRYLSEQKIVTPGYSVLQNMISVALTAEQERLGTIIETQLSSSDTDSLLQLLKNPYGLYEITRIKREPKDFGEKEMRREIERGE